MNMLVIPAIWVSFVFLAFLLISKIYRGKSKVADIIITIIVLISGVLWILLLAIAQYDEVVFPQEWWRFAPLGALTILIIVNALEGFGVISHTSECPKNLSAI